MAEISSSSAQTFTLLSWNIDGLDGRNIIERTQAVCDWILSREPHAIFLQEVVPPTEKEILKKLGDKYDYFSLPHAAARYYVSILVLKTKHLLIHGALKYVHFPTSSMGRHVLSLPVSYCGVQMELLTSHLESMKDNAEERKDQLKIVFELMADLQQKRQEQACIFGGDLNVRDEEVGAVGLPPNTVDVWEACGSQQKDKYTWDMSKNDNLEWRTPNKSKLRFDRIYLSSSVDGNVSARSFSLVGKERLPGCERFCSDHWGLWVEFDIVRV